MIGRASAVAAPHNSRRSGCSVDRCLPLDDDHRSAENTDRHCDVEQSERTAPRRTDERTDCRGALAPLEDAESVLALDRPKHDVLLARLHVAGGAAADEYLVTGLEPALTESAPFAGARGSVGFVSGKLVVTPDLVRSGEHRSRLVAVGVNSGAPRPGEIDFPFVYEHLAGVVGDAERYCPPLRPHRRPVPGRTHTHGAVDRLAPGAAGTDLDPDGESTVGPTHDPHGRRAVDLLYELVADTLGARDGRDQRLVARNDRASETDRPIGIAVDRSARGLAAPEGDRQPEPVECPLEDDPALQAERHGEADEERGHEQADEHRLQSGSRSVYLAVTTVEHSCTSPRSRTLARTGATSYGALFPACVHPQHMELRGERACNDCDATWSYFDTGAIVCPECGSPDTVARSDERAVHTDSPVDLDLTEVRALVDDAPREELADATTDTCREYVRKRGFVHGGDLRDVDDTYLAARELAGVADVVGRARTLTDDEEWYFLELLRGADAGERPAADDVPESMHAVRGLAYANAVRQYRRDVRSWLDAAEDPPGPEQARDVLQTLEEHVKRVRALQGDVSPTEADALVAAARGIGSYLRAEDPDGLARAREHLAGLADVE